MPMLIEHIDAIARKKQRCPTYKLSFTLAIWEGKNVCEVRDPLAGEIKNRIGLQNQRATE